VAQCCPRCRLPQPVAAAAAASSEAPPRLPGPARARSCPLPLHTLFRSSGESSVGLDSDGFKTAEKRAWHDGLSYASDAVRDLNVATNEPFSPNPDKLSEDAKAAARQVAQSTFSTSTKIGRAHV